MPPLISLVILLISFLHHFLSFGLVLLFLSFYFYLISFFCYAVLAYLSLYKCFLLCSVLVYCIRIVTKVKCVLFVNVLITKQKTTVIFWYAVAL